MHRRTLRAAACVGALAATAGAPAIADAAIPGTQPVKVAAARSLGAMPQHTMSFTIALAPRDRAGLRALVSSRHAPLTPAQFRARYSPSAAITAAVVRWARSQGLTSRVSADRLLVTLTGSSTAVARALHTSFGEFSAPSAGRYFALRTPATLPAGIARAAGGVVGLSSLGRFSLPLRSHPAASPGVNYPATYGPQDFWSIYNAPSSATGTGQQLAIITEGNLSGPKSDLATFEQHYGLPAVTWNQIQVGAPSSDTSGSDEWDLDSQYSTGFAPGVSQLNVYVGTSLANTDVVNTIDRFVSDNLSRQGSFSAGECELLASASGLLGALDPVLQKADAQGQTMFFSSGDTGAFCPAIVGVNGVPAGLPNVSYPASSPYGIGVGGTSLLSQSGPETAWYAGGGGPSALESTPAWQTAGVGGVAPQATRGVPDVSLDADPASGYNVFVAGQPTSIGGTSASAPAWQGIWARAQGAHTGTLGFAGPVLYSAGEASAYRDVTLGANGFPALPGWDYATGFGSVDIAKFVTGA